MLTHCGFFSFFQQLQSTVLGKESSRRYFEAVPGDCKGELFGIKNLFRLQTQGTCLTQKILEVRILNSNNQMLSLTNLNFAELCLWLMKRQSQLYYISLEFSLIWSCNLLVALNWNVKIYHMFYLTAWRTCGGWSQNH